MRVEPRIGSAGSRVPDPHNAGREPRQTRSNYPRDGVRRGRGSQASTQPTHERRVITQRLFFRGSEPLPVLQEPRVAVLFESHGAEHQGSLLIPQRTLVDAKPGRHHLEAPDPLPPQEPLSQVIAQPLPLAEANRCTGAVVEESPRCDHRTYRVAAHCHERDSNRRQDAGSPSAVARRCCTAATCPVRTS
jgi:hypothetical protein